MASTRSMIAQYIPKNLLPYARRLIRRIDQLAGYPSSSQSPGVVMMLHIGRCGSTVLANLLDQHPKIFWDGKIYRNAKDLYGYDIQKIDYLRWTKRQFSASGKRYYGFEFKILNDQYPAKIGVPLQRFLEECEAMGVTHYILLVRRNTLRHILSHYSSKERGLWHISTLDKVNPKQFVLDIESITTGSDPGRPLLRYLQEVEDTHNAVRKVLQNKFFLEISYELDIEKGGALIAYEKICSFLQLDPVHVTINNRRINPFAISDTLLNYNQVATELKDSRFQWMLEDDR